MKSITLILTTAFALVSFSSCCCQTQSAPPLRPMPRDCEETHFVPQPDQPVKVFPGDKGK